MEFDLNMDDQESASGIGEPIASGVYLFVATEAEEFKADSGKQGINLTVRAVCPPGNTDEEQHGRYARPTFWVSAKAAKFLKGWMDAAKVSYNGKGVNLNSIPGVVFRGRIRSYLENPEDAYAKQDLLHFEEATAEDRKIASQYIAEWTGEDKPPATVGRARTAPSQGASETPSDLEDDDEPVF